jgi:N-acetyl-gamma-glutamyl-phosphate reductase
MENKIKVGIIGGAGYTGGELIRLLVNHHAVDLVAIHSKSNAGNAVSAVHGDLVGDTSLFFSGDDSFLKDGSVDILFLCVGHGDAKKFLTENEVNSKTKIIDLSQGNLYMAYLS